MKLTRTLALAMGMAALAGTTAVAQKAERDGDSERQSRAVTVSVENRNWLDVRVYAVSGTRVQKLGNVFGFGEEAFELPRYFTTPGTDLRIVAVPIGRRGATSSQTIWVTPGDHVVYRVEGHLPLSAARVAPRRS